MIYIKTHNLVQGTIRICSNAQRLPDVHALQEISDYSIPRAAWMRVESLVRIILNKILPKWLSKFMKSMPMNLISTTDLSYSQVLERNRWWTERIKKVGRRLFLQYPIASV
jgi:hypothetical protein